MGGFSKYNEDTGTDTGAGIFSLWKSRQNSFSLPQPVVLKKTKVKTPKKKTAFAKGVNSAVNAVVKPKPRTTSAARQTMKRGRLVRMNIR